MCTCVCMYACICREELSLCVYVWVFLSQLMLVEIMLSNNVFYTITWVTPEIKNNQRL